MPKIPTTVATPVHDKFIAYPEDIRDALLNIRTLIFDIAREDNLGVIEETLKWGEPAYLIKGGSTVRIDWKPATPNQYAIYFNCKTRLIDTFREIYRDNLQFSGVRAIIFQRDEVVPWPALRHCLAMALQYHRLKHLPLLGA